ncbi:MAG: hypothetical protein ACFHXK_09215 [bacterium]
MSDEELKEKALKILIRLDEEGSWPVTSSDLIRFAETVYGQGKPMTLSELRHAVEQISGNAEEEISEGWAMAARDGGRIDPEVVDEMKKDRDQARDLSKDFNSEDG